MNLLEGTELVAANSQALVTALITVAYPFFLVYLSQEGLYGIYVSNTCSTYDTLAYKAMAEGKKQMYLF